MSVALAALRAGAAALLDADGRAALADLVRAARVELAGPGATWSMGAREVTAHRVALALPAPAFVAIARDPASLDAVRAAFARAMRSPETELAELHVELLLPGVDRGWRSAYREAPERRRPAEPPDPEAVLAGAAALLAATGDAAGAELLSRARLDLVLLAGAECPLTRVIVWLRPDDRARTWEDPALEERLRRAIHDAALHAGERVAVEIGVISVS
jgi:hypothetical protein